MVQDAASLNCNTHKKTEGIGYISGKTLGVNIRTCLAVTAGGLVPGAADQNNREEARDERRTHESKKVRLLEEKERCRRGTTLGESARSIPQEGQLFLVRTAQNRMTVDNKRIAEEIRRQPCAGRARVTIPRASAGT